MKNLTLTRGRCANCNDKIDGNRALGTVCAPCREDAHPLRVRVFGPENFEFAAVVKSAHGRKPEIDFTGTKVLVNNKVGKVSTTYGDSSVVDFDDDLTSTALAIGWWELKWLLTQAIG